jgi:hypothetical protein
MNIMDPRKLAVCYGDLRKNGFQKAFGHTSMPEIEDHEESTSENELSDIPEEIINALYSFDCDSDEDFVGFE